jgi:high-affinity K+ transport system ATPase subunit B
MEGIVKHASFLHTVKTVLWGMIGIRRKADHEKTPLNPVHLAIVAVAFVVLFILTLVTIVRIVTS